MIKCSPAQEIDLESIIFIERYVTNLLKWDLLTFFGHQPRVQKSIEEIVHHLGRSYGAVRSELGDLVMLGLLQQIPSEDHHRYQLTTNAILRGQIIQFAKSQPKML